MLEHIKEFVQNIGSVGIFLGAFLDSSFLSLPEIIDLLLIYLCLKGSFVKVIGIILLAISGSLLGNITVFMLVKNGVYLIFKKSLEHKWVERFKSLLIKYDIAFLLISAVLPPPFPFKLTVILAGIVRFSFLRFFIAVAFGRGIRFTLEGILAWKYGNLALNLLNKYYPWITISIIILILIWLVVKKLKFSKCLNSVLTPRG